MNLADWVTRYSRYQTANLLTPLPATSNWNNLQPLNERGELLQEGEMRPYHLNTGRQLVMAVTELTESLKRALLDSRKPSAIRVVDEQRRQRPDDLLGQVTVRSLAATSNKPGGTASTAMTP